MSDDAVVQVSSNYNRVETAQEALLAPFLEPSNPIVYTMKLDDMQAIVRHTLLRHPREILNEIEKESKPLYNHSGSVRNRSFINLKRYKRLTQVMEELNYSQLNLNRGPEKSTEHRALISEHYVVFVNHYINNIDLYYIDGLRLPTECYRINTVDLNALKGYVKDRKYITHEVCCWYKREKIIEDIKYTRLDDTFAFMRKRHDCNPGACTCCCRPAIRRSLGYVTKLTHSADMPETRIHKINDCFQRLFDTYSDCTIESMIPNNKPIENKYLLNNKVLSALVTFTDIKKTQCEDYGIDSERGIYYYQINPKYSEVNTLPGIRHVVTQICCWFKRENVIMNLQKNDLINSGAALAMRTPHRCKGVCTCCCRQNTSSPVKIFLNHPQHQIRTANNQPLTDSRSVQNTFFHPPHDQKDHEDHAKDCLEKEPLIINPSQCYVASYDNASASKSRFRDVIKAIEQLNVLTVAVKKSSLNPRLPPQIEEKQQLIDTLCERKTQTNSESNVETGECSPSTENIVESDSDSAKNIIKYARERFEDIQFTINEQCKVVVTLKNNVTSLSNDELKILRDVIIRAQKHVDGLGLAPGTNFDFEDCFAHLDEPLLEGIDMADADIPLIDPTKMCTAIDPLHEVDLHEYELHSKENIRLYKQVVSDEPLIKGIQITDPCEIEISSPHSSESYIEKDQFYKVNLNESRTQLLENTKDVETKEQVEAEGIRKAVEKQKCGRTSEDKRNTSSMPEIATDNLVVLSGKLEEQNRSEASDFELGRTSEYKTYKKAGTVETIVRGKNRSSKLKQATDDSISKRENSKKQTAALSFEREKPSTDNFDKQKRDVALQFYCASLENMAGNKYQLLRLSFLSQIKGKDPKPKRLRNSKKKHQYKKFNNVARCHVPKFHRALETPKTRIMTLKDFNLDDPEIDNVQDIQIPKEHGNPESIIGIGSFHEVNLHETEIKSFDNIEAPIAFEKDPLLKQYKAPSNPSFETNNQLKVVVLPSLVSGNTDITSMVLDDPSTVAVETMTITANFANKGSDMDESETITLHRGEFLKPGMSLLRDDVICIQEDSPASATINMNPLEIYAISEEQNTATCINSLSSESVSDTTTSSDILISPHVPPKTCDIFSKTPKPGYMLVIEDDEDDNLLYNTNVKSAGNENILGI